jgi:hypothetical protein
MLHRPMPLVRIPEPFDHPDWLFELKHDGFRAVAYVDGHHMRQFRWLSSQFRTPLAICMLSSFISTSCSKNTDHAVDLPESPCVVTPSPSAPSGATVVRKTEAEKFLPPYRRILECTGWLEYVDSNVDVVRYYDFPSFQSASGLAVGLARYENGRRIADIAIKDRPDVDVVTTIVHEAAHLSGISQLGTYLDQDAAHGVETRFLLDARTRRLLTQQ